MYLMFLCFRALEASPLNFLEKKISKFPARNMHELHFTLEGIAPFPVNLGGKTGIVCTYLDKGIKYPFPLPPPPRHQLTDILWVDQ